MVTPFACTLCTAAGREPGPRVRGNGRIRICVDCKALWVTRGKRWCNRGSGHLVTHDEWSSGAKCCKACRNAAEAGTRERTARDRQREYDAAWRRQSPAYYRERHARRKLEVWRGER